MKTVNIGAWKNSVAATKLARTDQQNFLKWYKFEVDLEWRGNVDLRCMVICASVDL